MIIVNEIVLMLALQITPALRVFFYVDIYGDRIYNKSRKIYGNRT